MVTAAPSHRHQPLTFTVATCWAKCLARGHVDVQVSSTRDRTANPHRCDQRSVTLHICNKRGSSHKVTLWWLNTAAGPLRRDLATGRRCPPTRGRLQQRGHDEAARSFRRERTTLGVFFTSRQRVRRRLDGGSRSHRFKLLSGFYFLFALVVTVC